jgi:AraC-like DNA-binding protein/mannose-6-phosphate isomerase-like protein (cupin superfamily)
MKELKQQHSDNNYLFNNTHWNFIKNDGFQLLQLHSDISITILNIRGQNDDFSMQASYVDMNDKQDFALVSLSRAQLNANPFLHNHNRYELVYILEGEAFSCIEGHRLHLKAGNSYMINHSINHSTEFFTAFSAIYFTFSSNIVINWLSCEQFYMDSPLSHFFKGTLAQNISIEKRYIEFSQVYPENSSSAMPTIKAIEIEMSEKKPGYTSLIQGLVTRLFYTLQNPEEYQLNYVNLQQPEEYCLFEDVMRYLENIKRHVTRKELENNLHYSGNYINRIIKKYAGVSLQEFNKNIYMKEAERLLRSTDMSISEIVRLLGFENRTHFYKMFQGIYGATPAEYRLIQQHN